jgi:hypothetical protein
VTTEPPKPIAPDRPSVPRPKRSILAIFMIALSFVIVGGYTVLAFTQRELGTPERDEIPASVRSSPGGYRSYHFWHSGYHGGK